MSYTGLVCSGGLTLWSLSFPLPPAPSCAGLWITPTNCIRTCPSSSPPPMMTTCPTGTGARTRPSITAMPAAGWRSGTARPWGASARSTPARPTTSGARTVCGSPRWISSTTRRCPPPCSPPWRTGPGSWAAPPSTARWASPTWTGRVCWWRASTAAAASSPTTTIPTTSTTWPPWAT